MTSSTPPVPGAGPVQGLASSGGTLCAVKENSVSLLGGGGSWQEIDTSGIPADGRRRRSLAASAKLVSVAIEGDARVWVVTSSGSLWRFSPAQQQWDRAAPPGSASAVAADAAAGIFYLDADGASVKRFDPVRNKVLNSYKVPTTVTSLAAGPKILAAWGGPGKAVFVLDLASSGAGWRPLQASGAPVLACAVSLDSQQYIWLALYDPETVRNWRG